MYLETVFSFQKAKSVGSPVRYVEVDEVAFIIQSTTTRRITLHGYPDKLRLPAEVVQSMERLGHITYGRAVDILTDLFQGRKWEKTAYARDIAKVFWHQMFDEDFPGFMDEAEDDFFEEDVFELVVEALLIPFMTGSQGFSAYVYEQFKDFSHEFMHKVMIDVVSRLDLLQPSVVNSLIYILQQGSHSQALTGLLESGLIKNNRKLLLMCIRHYNKLQLVDSLAQCIVGYISASSYWDNFFIVLKQCSKKLLKKRKIFWHLCEDQAVPIKYIERYLLEIDDEVDVTYSGYAAPLSLAMQIDHLELAELLIKYGANVTQALEDNRHWDIPHNNAIAYAKRVEPLYLKLSKRRSRSRKSYAKFYAEPGCIEAAKEGLTLKNIEKLLEYKKTYSATDLL